VDDDVRTTLRITDAQPVESLCQPRRESQFAAKPRDVEAWVQTVHRNAGVLKLTRQSCENMISISLVFE
jgi:hypothetical protein